MGGKPEWTSRYYSYCVRYYYSNCARKKLGNFFSIQPSSLYMYMIYYSTFLIPLVCWPRVRVGASNVNSSANCTFPEKLSTVSGNFHFFFFLFVVKFRNVSSLLFTFVFQWLCRRNSTPSFSRSEICFFFSSRSVSYQEIRTADKNIAPNSSTFSKICTSFCFVSFPCVLVRVLLRTFYKYKDNSFPPIDISLYYKFQWRQKKIVYIDNILP